MFSLIIHIKLCDVLHAKVWFIRNRPAMVLLPVHVVQHLKMAAKVVLNYFNVYNGRLTIHHIHDHAQNWATVKEFQALKVKQERNIEKGISKPRICHSAIAKCTKSVATQTE